MIKVFHLNDNDRPTMFVMVPPDDRGIGLAPVAGVLLRHPMAADGFGGKMLGRWLVPLGREEEIDRVASLVHRAIQRAPLAFALDIRIPLANEAPTPQTLRTVIRGCVRVVGEWPKQPND
jgi:hypothetical protein